MIKSFKYESTRNFFYYGNLQLFEDPAQVYIIYSSRNIPEQYLNDFEVFYHALLEQNLILGSGWQSALEKQIFSLWKSNPISPIIYFTAKLLNPPKKSSQEQLDLIMPDNFLAIDTGIKSLRITKKSVEQRDSFILTFMTNFIFTYISPGGYCEQLLEKVVDSGKNVFIFNHSSNESYLNDSVTAIDSFSLDLLRCF